MLSVNVPRNFSLKIQDWTTFDVRLTRFLVVSMTTIAVCSVVGAATILYALYVVLADWSVRFAIWLNTDFAAWFKEYSTPLFIVTILLELIILGRTVVKAFQPVDDKQPDCSR